MIFQSRWGFHPVAQDDFLILKALKKRYWLAVKGAAMWCRWARKAEQNRVIRRSTTKERFGGDKPLLHTEVSYKTWPEPRIDAAIFSQRFIDRFRSVRDPHLIWQWLGLNKDLEKLLDDFDKARNPKATPGEVETLDMGPYRRFLKEN